MSESAVLYFSALFTLTFFILGGMIGWFVREYLNSDDEPKGYLHPEFFDRNGNLINEELLTVHFVDEDEEDYDED